MATFRIISIIFLFVLTASCANPLHQATSDRYSLACDKAQNRGNLIGAEEACYRALVNVDWGNLGKDQKSLKMYELARIKRHLGKFEEAESLYKESIAIEEKLIPVSNERIGRRSAELAIVYADQKRFIEGLPYVNRLFPLADLYKGNEKKTVAAIFYVYSKELPKKVPSDVTTKFANKAIEMGFDPKTYKK